MRVVFEYPAVWQRLECRSSFPAVTEPLRGAVVGACRARPQQHLGLCRPQSLPDRPEAAWGQPPAWNNKCSLHIKPKSHSECHRCLDFPLSGDSVATLVGCRAAPGTNNYTVSGCHTAWTILMVFPMYEHVQVKHSLQFTASKFYQNHRAWIWLWLGVPGRQRAVRWAWEVTLQRQGEQRSPLAISSCWTRHNSAAVFCTWYWNLPRMLSPLWWFCTQRSLP